jgi:hypothetical protein
MGFLNLNTVNPHSMLHGKLVILISIRLNRIISPYFSLIAHNGVLNNTFVLLERIEILNKNMIIINFDYLVLFTILIIQKFPA